MSTIDESLLETIAARAESPSLRARACDTLASEKPSLLDHDAAILEYILQVTGVRLKDETSHSLETELQEWDRDHLSHLARTLPVFTRAPRDTAKLAFLIRHSIRQDFFDAVTDASDPVGNPWGVYNANMLEALDVAGFKSSAWISNQQPVHYGKAVTDGHERVFRFSEWSRDFRREFAVGNYSTCCIAVGDIQKKNRYAIRPDYQTILLDYFLDLSIKSIFINERVTTENKTWWLPFGQHYVFPALDAASGERVLAITATELRMRSSFPITSIVPALVSPFEGEDGYLEAFNANAVFVGERFSEYTAFAREVKERATRLDMRMHALRNNLKQARQNLVQSDPADVDAYQANLKANKEIRHSLNADIASLTSRAKTFCDFVRRPLQKIGLAEAIKTDLPWHGTDYLDIFGLLPPPNFHGSDAYEGRRFTPRLVPKEIRGHAVYRGQIAKLLQHVDVVESTYFPAKQGKKQR